MKINKNNKCKEFYSYFHFVGQVKCHVRGFGGDIETRPIFETTTTTTGKPRRVLQFDLHTDKYNKLKIELGGMEFEKATLYSSTAKATHRIAWKDRQDKTKYPDTTYSLLNGTDWDNCGLWGNLLSEGDWVEVKGKYEFSIYTSSEGEVFPTIKRRPTSISIVESGQEITLRNKKTMQYVCDFDSPQFQEVNNYVLDVGIKSTYQDNDKNTKVNGVFLSYGKERSEVNDVNLMVYHKEPQKGKQSLADAFAKLTRLDFVTVSGVDNNKLIFGEVASESSDSDPFADVDEQDASLRRAIIGTRRGLEVLSVVADSAVRGALTEAEISPAGVEVLSTGFADDELFF